MLVPLNRLDPNLPDPVESRRRAASRLVRAIYAAVVFGILGFFIVYFGAPLVYLGGPGVVTSPLVVVSLPYVVQVKQMHVTGGSEVKAGDEIGRVWSPQQDAVLANFMQSMAEVTVRSAELRIKARVARDTLEVVRSYLRVTEEAVARLEASTVASTIFRIQAYREHATARKTIVAQEVELAETSAQLARLDELDRQVREHIQEIKRSFADGRVVAPINGIISTGPARAGQSLVAGSPVAEILDPRDVFVRWYIPNTRFADPEVGHEVRVVFGRLRLRGTIADVLPVSGVYGGASHALNRESSTGQIAVIRLAAGVEAPALNSTVQVRMYYSNSIGWLVSFLARTIGLDGT
jgi:multidrug resistance efflux pump